LKINENPLSESLGDFFMGFQTCEMMGFGKIAKCCLVNNTIVGF
jgi:hypothetical protein